MGNGGDKKFAGKKECFNWKNLVFCLIVTAILLQIVGYSKSQGEGEYHFLRSSTDGFFNFGSPRRNFRAVIPGPLTKKFTNIIVMSSNPRSGSSYTGELLSASRDSSFFFEPLWYFIDAHKNKQPSFEDKKSLLMNLLKCNFRDPRIKKMLYSTRQSSFVFRKPSILGLRYDDKSVIERSGFVKKMEIRCRRTKTRVIKTIRLNMTEIHSIITSLPEEGPVNQNNFHVIYLARDPRGIINSVKNLKEQWPERFLSPQHICSRLHNDSLFQSNHSLPQLRVLRYEDIARHPQKELQAISNHFNLSLVEEAKTFVHEHASANWNAKDFKRGTWAPSHRKISEDALGDIFQTLAKKKLFAKESEELKEDVIVDNKNNRNTNEGNVDADDDDEHVSDYYDADGKIATLRKKRSTSFKRLSAHTAHSAHTSQNLGSSKRSKRSNIKAVNELDPLGRSYYYSTYRKKGFSPNHWRDQLSRDILNEIANETSCNAVFEAFGYPKE
eukprot:GFUD01000761.1.p1 GENE.GFUD01000761.1~~GFUD01000761.1.p1  ORF type:complete len:498 (+),score=64.09 GFUD01000761.1:253-1746(+)